MAIPSSTVAKLAVLLLFILPCGFPASASRAPVTTTTTAAASPQSTAGGNVIGDADRMASAVNNASVGGTESAAMTRPQAYDNSTGFVQDWCNIFCNRKACKNYTSRLCENQPPSCYPTCYCPTNSCFCFCPR